MLTFCIIGTVDAEIFKGILFSRLGLTSKFKSSNYSSTKMKSSNYLCNYGTFPRVDTATSMTLRRYSKPVDQTADRRGLM